MGRSENELLIKNMNKEEKIRKIEEEIDVVLELLEKTDEYKVNDNIKDKDYDIIKMGNSKRIKINSKIIDFIIELKYNGLGIDYESNLNKLFKSLETTYKLYSSKLSNFIIENLIVTKQNSSIYDVVFLTKIKTDEDDDIYKNYYYKITFGRINDKVTKIYVNNPSLFFVFVEIFNELIEKLYETEFSLKRIELMFRDNIYRNFFIEEFKKRRMENILNFIDLKEKINYVELEIK